MVKYSVDGCLTGGVFLQAQVIVKTIRERITINYIRALQFAKKNYFVKWLVDATQWEGKHNNDYHLDEIMYDPAI